MADPTQSNYAGGQSSTGTYTSSTDQDDVNYSAGTYAVQSPSGYGGGGNWGNPSAQDLGYSWGYVTPEAFNDYNAENIYSTINAGINQRADTNAPMAALTGLGATQYGQNATVAPQMMVSGANIAPQMLTNSAMAATGLDQLYGAGQQQNINDLYLQSLGLGPSVAQQTAHEQALQNTQAQQAILGSQRGMGAAQGLRAAGMQAAQARASAAQAGALGRQQEALGAQGALQEALQQARGQGQTLDQYQVGLAGQSLLGNQSAYNQAGIQQAQFNQAAGLANQSTGLGASGTNAQLLQQMALANMGYGNAQALQQGQMNSAANVANSAAQVQQNQLNNNAYLQGLTAYMGQNQTDISNQAAYQQLASQQQSDIAAILNDVQINTANNQLGLIGAGFGGAGALLGAAASPSSSATSDERAKKSVRQAGGELVGFLNAIGCGL